MGRPSKRTPEIEAAIIEGLSRGTPLTVVCRELGICDRTVRNWQEEDEAFSAAIACAREAGEDWLANECLTIVDNTDEDPASRRVRADTRLKLLAKFNPKRWGDRTVLAGDKENPLHGLSEGQLESRIAELIAKGAG